MPRKRSKPIAEHVEQQGDLEVPPPETSGGEPTATSASPAGDPPDAAPVMELSADESAPRAGKNRTPDPHPYASVTLGATNHAPKMRLWRSERRNEFAITFDEKPDAKYLDMVKEAGFHRNPDNTAWVMKMPHGERWKAEVAARGAFNEIGDAIRTDMGLPVYRGYE